MANTKSAPLIALTVLAFLIGEKSVETIKLASAGFDMLFRDKGDETYIIQASLLAIAVGLAGATFFAIALDSGERDHKDKVFLAAITGTIGGFFEIAETMAFEPEAAPLSWQPFFFFVVFLLVFLVPPMHARFVKLDKQVVKHRLLLISAAILIGSVAGLISSLIVDLTVYSLPQIFGETEKLRNAGSRLVFDPLAFVWLGTAFVMVTFLPSSGKAAIRDKGWKRAVWPSAYIAIASLAGFFYASITGKTALSPEIQPLIPITFGFAIVSAAPMIGYVLVGASKRGVNQLNTSYACLSVFASTMVAMALSLAAGAGDNLWAYSSASALMGFCGIAIVFAIKLSFSATARYLKASSATTADTDLAC